MPQESCPATLLPYRQLALRVIDLALRDASGPTGSADRASARAFLSGSRMLAHWCEVAEVDPRWMAARAGIAMAHRKTQSPREA
jgi:hypothetical protein